MDFKFTKSEGLEDVDMDVSTVFSNIYSACDTENTNAVCVSRLIEFIRPYMMEDLEALEELRGSLDPENKDLQVSGDFFKDQLLKWSKKLTGSPEPETDFNRTPSQLQSIEDRELPYLHSTPRASLGDKLLRCKDLLNLSNVSGYSLSTSKLDATNYVDPNNTILEEEVKRLQHQLSKTLNELTMIKNQLTLSEEANEVMQNDIVRLNRRLLAEQQVNEHLQKDKLYNEELRDEINVYRKTIDDLKRNLVCYEKEIDDFKDAITDLEQEKMKLEKKAEHVSRQKQDILKENFELKTEMETYQQQLADIKKINDELKSKFTEQKDLIDQLRDENDILNHQRLTLEKALKGKSSSSPLEQDSPPLGNGMSHTHQNNGTVFAFPPSESRRKSKLPLLKNVLIKKTNNSMSTSTPLIDATLPKQSLSSDSFTGSTVSPIGQNLTSYQTAIGAHNESQNSSEEDIFWKIHSGSKNSSGSENNLGESLQTEICKVNPMFKNDSTTFFETHEQIFLLEDEVNNLKKSLKDLQTENHKLIKELKEKKAAHEDLVSSNFVLATNLETTKSKIDTLKDLLNQKHNTEKESKSIQVDTWDDEMQLAKKLHEQLKTTLKDHKKSAAQTAELMREFGQLTVEKLDIESKLNFLQEEKTKCEKNFKLEIEVIEKRLVEQENMFSTLNENLTTVVQDNIKLEELKSRFEEDIFCLKSELETVAKQNIQLLQCINNLQDEATNKQQQLDSCVKSFESKIKIKEQEVLSLTESMKDLDRQLREQQRDNKVDGLKQNLNKELENQLENLREKNKQLLQCISDLQDKYNNKQLELENCMKEFEEKLKSKADEFEKKIKLKEQETNNLKEIVETELQKNLDQQLENQKNDFMEKITQKEQEINNLKENIILKEDESNWLKENLIRQLKSEYDEKMKTQNEEFVQKIKLKEEENVHFKENLEKRLKLEFEEKLKHSIDSEEKMFALTTKCENLETALGSALKNVRSKSAAFKELETKLKAGQKELQELGSSKDKLEIKIQNLQAAKTKLELEKLSVDEQLKTLKIDFEEKVLEQQKTITELRKDLQDSEHRYKCQINSFEETKLELQNKILERIKKLDFMSSENERLERISLEIKENSFILKDDYECLKTKNKCLNQQVLNLNSANEQAIDTLKKELNTETEHLKKQLLIQNNELEHLKINLDKKIQELYDAEQKIIALTDKCEFLEKDLNSTLHNLYDKTDLYDKVSSDWQSVESELKGMFAAKLDLEQTVIELRNQVKQLSEEKMFFEENQIVFNEEKQVLEKKLKEQDDKTQNLHNDIRNLENDLATLKIKNINLVDINNNKSQELESLYCVLNQEKNSNIQNRTEIKSLKDLLEEKLTQLDLKDEVITRISEKLEKLKSLLESAELENSKLLKIINDLRRRNLSKEKDLESINFALETEKNKSSMFSGEITLKDEEIKKILFQLVDIKSLLEKSESAYQTLLNDVESKEHENIFLKYELSQFKTSAEGKLEASNSTESLSGPVEKKTSFSKQQIALERLKERLEKVECDLKTEKKTNNRLSTELKDLRKSLQDKADDIKSLTTKKLSLEEIIDDLKTKLEHEETITCNLNIKLQELESRLEICGEENQKLQEDLLKSNNLKKKELLEIQIKIQAAKEELSLIQKESSESRGQLENTRKELQITQENFLRMKEEESAKWEGRNKNIFTLRGPHLDRSRPSSPDSLSSDLEVNGLPDKKVFYQSSDFNSSKNTVIEIPNFVLSDISDEFLEEIGLSEQSPRKKFTKEETEKKVTTLAVRLFVNSKDVEERFEKRKEVYINKYEEFLSLASDISYRLRDHVCIGTSEPISPVFILLEELKQRVKALVQSASEIGILAYESRMKRCWNLVTNYMTMLRTENELLKGNSTNLENTPTQTLRRRLITTSAGSANGDNAPFGLVRRRNLAAKCRYAIYTMGFAAFVVTVALALHLHCRLTVSENQYCPLDDFITRQVTGIPPM